MNGRAVYYLYFGLDASPRGAAMALTDALESEGLRPTLTWADRSQLITTHSEQGSRTALRLFVNDSYFDADHGGQELLSAYPITAECRNEATIDTFDERVRQIFSTAARRLAWPTIQTGVHGELVAAFLPHFGYGDFGSTDITPDSPRERWEPWIDPGPWPTVADELEP